MVMLVPAMSTSMFRFLLELLHRHRQEQVGKIQICLLGQNA